MQTLRLLGPDTTPEGRRWRINGHVAVEGMHSAQDCRLADVFHEPTAQLFAAAPDLLEAAKLVLCGAAPETLKAAVLKAEGGR